jgi:signal-transduction protein with cAMP-binding, CBS, and nucleotidyltransferase domain
MSVPLVTIDAEAPIGLGVEMMVNKNIRRLMVTEKGEIVGIITQKDLLKGTLEAFQALHSRAHSCGVEALHGEIEALVNLAKAI